MSPRSEYVCSFDVAPIALPDKVLVHLVLPRCEVVSVKFLGRKSASHLSVHIETTCLERVFFLLYDTRSAYCCYNDQLVLHERGLRHNTCGWGGIT